MHALQERLHGMRCGDGSRACGVEKAQVRDSRFVLPLSLGFNGTLRLRLILLHAVLTSGISGVTSARVEHCVTFLEAGCRYCRLLHGWGCTRGFWFYRQTPARRCEDTMAERRRHRDVKHEQAGAGVHSDTYSMSRYT